MAHEWARTEDDVLWRRIEARACASPREERARLATYMAGAVGRPRERSLKF